MQLVAGRLNILAAEEGGSAAEPVYRNGDGESNVEARERLVAQGSRGEVALLRDCFATDVAAEVLRRGGVRSDALQMARPTLRMRAMAEIAVTAARDRARGIRRLSALSIAVAHGS